MQTSKALAVIVALATLVALASSPDPLLTGAIGGVLVMALVLLWPPSDVPILMLPFGLQWLSVALKPLQSAFSGRPLDDLAEFGGTLTPAAWLAAGGLAALALGMRIGVGVQRIDRNALLARETAALPEALVIGASLAAIVVGHLLDAVAPNLGSALQIALAVSNVRLAGIFILSFWCLVTRRRLGLLAAVTIFELIFGMTGFFSDFKSALLVFVIAVVAASPRVNIASIAVGFGAAALLLGAAIYWSAIKPEYRAFLNGGTGEQIVVQPMNARIAYLQGALENFDHADFDKGIDALIERQSYIDFLAQTLAYVPARRPHENGALTIQTLEQTVTPRLLFPNKAALVSDTVMTERYTGLSFNNPDTTSISIGWLGDLYIDFGALGAIIGAFIIGVSIGAIEKTLVGFRGAPLLANLAIAAAAMMPFIVFERTLIKLVSSGVLMFAATFVLQRVFLGRALAAIGLGQIGSRAPYRHKPKQHTPRS